MEANGLAFLGKCVSLSRMENARKGGVPVWLAGVLAVLLLLVAGIGYRVMAAAVRTVRDTPIELPVPLSAVPAYIGGWVGEELPVPTVTKEYMETYFADDFISRRYINPTDGLWADVYVVYCSANPAGIVGHQPRVCFPGHGWIWDQTVPSEITSRSGLPIKCLVHCFHKPAPAYQQVFVLNFYVLNGQVTRSERDFANFLGRRPNLSGDPARYVAQIQISSILEHSTRAAARDMADTILSFLPDRDGQVKVNERGSGSASDSGSPSRQIALGASSPAPRDEVGGLSQAGYIARDRARGPQHIRSRSGIPLRSDTSLLGSRIPLPEGLTRVEGTVAGGQRRGE